VTEGWTPEFEGQRPPFTPGHTLSVKSGAYSDRFLEPRADAVLARLAEQAPEWIRTVDAHAVRAWAFVEARCELLREYVQGLPLTQPDGRPWPAAEDLLRWEKRAAEARSRLGLDPTSRARLQRDTGAAVAAAAGVAALAERGREAVERAGGGS
jgi:hypothetical protein